MSKNTKNEFVNEHDSLFKAFFGVKQTMLDYLNNFLPKELLKFIVIESLVLDTTNYSDADSKAFQSDVVYRANLTLKNKRSKPLAIVFLLEHKSYPYAYIFVQLLTCVCRIWNDDLKNKRKLSFILPVVIYHSKKTWIYKPFSAQFKSLPKVFHGFIPSFDYHLTNVNEVQKEILEKLKGTSILQSLFLAFQKIDDTTYLNENMLELFISFEGKPELQEVLQMFFGYITKKSELSAKEVVKRVKNLFSNPKNSEFMSTYDSIKAEGRAEGKAEGKAEGILRLLKNGKLTIKEIAEVFGETQAYILKIKKESNL